MSKIQEIKRKNGSTVNFVNIPKEAMELSKLHKGDNVEVKAKGEGKLEITQNGTGTNIL